MQKVYQIRNLCFYVNIIVYLLVHVPKITPKNVEGHLKTLKDWEFLARFCFFSGRGQYEYYIEYERRYGEPQLLLYYDDKTQWPSVYKSTKTCKERLNVLSARDNQVVKLSSRSPHNLYSGCKLYSVPSKNLSSTKNIEIFQKEQSYIYKSDENQPSVSSDTTSIGVNDPKWTNISLENNTLFIDQTKTRLGNKDFSTEKRKKRSFSVHSQVFGNGRSGTVIVTCHNTGSFTSSRERWWYIVVANCGSVNGLNIRYKFRMTNGPPGDFWHEHFSADETNIPPILFTGGLAYSLLLILIFICGIELKSLHLYHLTYRLFTFSVFLEWIGLLFDCINWSKYAMTGLGPHRLIGGLLQGSSEVSFLLLIILMAKGFTITKARLSSFTIVKLTMFINLYTILFVSLYIYQEEAFDPGKVLNLYESPAGYGLAGLRCISWIIFIYFTGLTIKKYPEKRTFYCPLATFGTIWILGGPLITVIGPNILDSWVRESCMYGAIIAITFGGHIAFMWLTWPSRANKSFPYHIRTNHVGALQTSENNDGLDYPRHAYQPATDENIIIPLSKRTEQFLNRNDTKQLEITVFTEKEISTSLSRKMQELDCVRYSMQHNVPITTDTDKMESELPSTNASYKSLNFDKSTVTSYDQHQQHFIHEGNFYNRIKSAKAKSLSTYKFNKQRAFLAGTPNKGNKTILQPIESSLQDNLSSLEPIDFKLKVPRNLFLAESRL